MRQKLRLDWNDLRFFFVYLSSNQHRNEWIYAKIFKFANYFIQTYIYAFYMKFSKLSKQQKESHYIMIMWNLWSFACIIFIKQAFGTLELFLFYKVMHWFIQNFQTQFVFDAVPKQLILILSWSLFTTRGFFPSSFFMMQTRYHILMSKTFSYASSFIHPLSLLI